MKFIRSTLETKRVVSVKCDKTLEDADFRYRLTQRISSRSYQHNYTENKDRPSRHHKRCSRLNSLKRLDRNVRRQDCKNGIQFRPREKCAYNRIPKEIKVFHFEINFRLANVLGGHIWAKYCRQNALYIYVCNML